jgi:hypothetical protein
MFLLRPVFAALFGTIAAIAAWVAQYPWPGYVSFHWTVTLSALATAYFLRRRPFSLAACIAVAAVFNPIFPVHAGTAWPTYDRIAAIVMIVVAIDAWRTRYASPLIKNISRGGWRLW